MRLGQLARKLKVDSSTIVKFLAKNDIIIENAPNVKIEDDKLNLTLAHFEVKDVVNTSDKPAEEIVEVKEPVVSPSPTEIDPIDLSKKNEEEPVAFIEQEVITKSNTEEEDQTSSLEENTIPLTSDNAAQNEEDEKEIENLESDEEITLNEVDGVIRAPKVKLDGIKVVGKIDLPEPKQKEVEKKELTNKGDSTTINEENDASTSTEDNVHPNKKNRVKALKPTIIKDKKTSKKEDEKPLSKQEAKALRKAKQAQQKKKKRKKAAQINQSKQTAPKKKKKKATPPPPKRGFWARLFGFGK